MSAEPARGAYGAAVRAAYRHHGVPYFSQWSDAAHAVAVVERGADPCADPSWRDGGFDDAEHYRFWARRLCGLACLESLLAHWRLPRPPRRALLARALEHGAYRLRDDGGVHGLVYAPFGAWLAADFGLRVDVLGDAPLPALYRAIDRDTLAIASVGSNVREPQATAPRRGGHLVLLHGHDPRGVWLHNPSGGAGGQADVCLPQATLERFHGGRGMLVRRAAAAR